MLHSRGELLHQRTSAGCEWGSIAITPAALSEFGRTLFGRELAAPAIGQFVRPRRADGRRLERLHRRVCNMVERKLDTISNREVVRALEQDLIETLITCLVNGTLLGDRRSSEKRPDVLPAFEAMLGKECYRLLRAREICGFLGISEGTLRAKCSLALGMSPDRYQRLRRLKLLRAELLRAKSASEATVEETVVRYGFRTLHHFVMEYWRFYGEMPPIHPSDPADK
jgi:AraC-like DNA-binding protein